MIQQEVCESLFDAHKIEKQNSQTEPNNNLETLKGHTNNSMSTKESTTMESATMDAAEVLSATKEESHREPTDAEEAAVGGAEEEQWTGKELHQTSSLDRHSDPFAQRKGKTLV